MSARLSAPSLRRVAGVLHLAAGALLLCACHARAAIPEEPAVLTHPNADSRAELARLVSRALDGRAVTLADDALTTESTLTIEPAAHRDAQGRRVNGRETGRPERFHLLRDGPRCVLVHERTGRRFALHSATCQPR